MAEQAVHSSGSSTPDLDETLAGDETLDASGLSDLGAATPARGDSIGRYVIVERIGRGGMGIVYSAYDPELDRKVALKVLIPRSSEEAEDDGRRRLMREAQAMAQVSHPNVVAVHDVGIHEGQVFMAMEFIDGPTLKEWLDAQARSPRVLLEMFAQAGRGLAAAHAKGLVHRDFKPDNVMVSQDGAEARPRARVLDFGLVRALQSDEPAEVSSAELGLDDTSGSHDDPLTRMGQLLGTPAFMAPEQFAHGQVDARTDQFAFCVALWSALHGQHPFGGNNMAELAGRVISGRLDEPPSSARVNPRLRRALERGLSVDADARWPSMDDLLQELLRDPSRTRRRIVTVGVVLAGVGLTLGLQRLLHARAVDACNTLGTTTIAETWNDELRQRVRKAMLATGIEQAADVHTRVEPRIDRYVEQWIQARSQVCLASEVEERWESRTTMVAVDCLEERREFLWAFVGGLLYPDSIILSQAVTSAAMLRAPAQCVDEHYLAQQPDPLVDPERRAALAALHPKYSKAALLLENKKAEQSLVLLDELRPLVADLDYSPARLRLLGMQAKAHQAAGNDREAKVLYREALALAIELSAIDNAAGLSLGLTALHLSLSELDEARWAARMCMAFYRRLGESEDGLQMHRILHLLAWIEHRGGNFEAARANAQRALAISEQKLGEGHPSLSDDLCLSAMILLSRNESEEAEPFARRCVSLREKILGPSDRGLAKALQHLGDILRARGKREEALEMFERSLVILDQPHGQQSGELGLALGNMGMMLNELGRYEEAEAQIQRGVTILEAASGPEGYDLGICLLNLGNVRQNLRDHESARDAYLRALTIMDANPEAARAARGPLLANLGNTEYSLARYDDALLHQREALEIIEDTYGPEHSLVAMGLANLASTHQALEQHEEALATFRRALELGERALGPDHLDLAYLLVGLANALLDRDRAAEALPLAERSLTIRREHGATPVELASSQWSTARALQASDREPERAKTLATRALTAFEQLGDSTASDVRTFLDGS